MKKILFTLLLLGTISLGFAQEKGLLIVKGKFAYCGASATQITKDSITVLGKKFLKGISTCPILTGPSIANTYLVSNPTITPDGTDKTAWSLFWYYESVVQAPSWAVAPTQNRTFVVTNQPGGGMSNMWCMPCRILPKKINGVTLAECEGPINESAFPLDKAVRVVPGMTSVTQAPLGATYPVGTVVPTFKNK
jgi:hypothetical protein